MSLEVKIEKLTVAIEALTLALTSGAQVQNAPVTEETPKPKAKPEAKAEKEPEAKAEKEPEAKAESATLTVTLEDVKEELLKAARRDRKAEAKALLGEFGATKVSQLKESDYEEVVNKAKEL